MNLPPRNPNAGALNNAPNSPSAQAETAIHQQAVKESSNASTRVPQASAGAMDQLRANQAAQSTAETAADAQVHYYKALMQKDAGLTQGSKAIVDLADKYAPQGRDVDSIAQAIRAGLRL